MKKVLKMTLDINPEIDMRIKEYIRKNCLGLIITEMNKYQNSMGYVGEKSIITNITLDVE